MENFRKYEMMSEEKLDHKKIWIELKNNLQKNPSVLTPTLYVCPPGGSVGCLLWSKVLSLSLTNKATPVFSGFLFSYKIVWSQSWSLFSSLPNGVNAGLSPWEPQPRARYHIRTAKIPNANKSTIENV